MTEKFANKGGIIGNPNGVTDTNSEEFKVLQQKILEKANSYTPEEKLDNNLFGLKLRMESYIENEKPFRSTGDFICELIEAFGIKKKSFATYIGIEDSNLSALLKDRRKINADLAMKFSRISKTDPVLWLSIQTKNELKKVEAEKGKQYDKYSSEDLLKKAV